VDTFNEHATRERDIAEKKKRDAELTRAREREEAAQLEAARKNEEAWKRSLQQVANKPRPNQLRWLEHWGHDSSSSTRQASSSIPSSSTSNSSGPPPSSSALPAARLSAVPRAVPSQVVPVAVETAASLAQDYPPWPELETEWLLEQLKMPNRRRDDLYVWAETLKRPVEEVVREKERLRRLGRYRSPSRGRSW
jgi:hypothetical protein